MRLRYAIMLIILMWLPSTVLAESFIIENKNNAPLFTDKSGEVPANLKKNETTEKITPPEEPAVETEEAKHLLKIKAELDNEYAELVKEQETLGSRANIPSNAEEIKAYNQRTARLNELKADYEKRLKTFQAQVEAYNKKQIMAEEKAKKAETQTASQAESLSRTKAELDKEHSELMKEREALVSEASESDELSKTEKFEDYKAKVADFNERRIDYEERAKAYQEKAEAYNESLKVKE